MITHIEATYGEWFDEVKVDGLILDPKPSQAVFNHSPDGFAWGYEGSGPSQLALAILLEATGDDVFAKKYHQRFEEDIIARMPQRSDWVLDIDVFAWLDLKRLLHG